MAKPESLLKLAWTSEQTRRGFWAVVLVSLTLGLLLGSAIRFQELEQRETTLVNSARQLAATALVGVEDDLNLLLLKLSDLLVLDSVQGVRLLQEGDTPLSVGETSADFPSPGASQALETNWLDEGRLVEIALDISAGLPFDWLVVRLEASRLAPSPIVGTLVNWIAAPAISLVLGFLYLWLVGYSYLSRLRSLETFVREHGKSFLQTPISAEFIEAKTDLAPLGRALEEMRDVNKALVDKLQSQMRFLHETPTPLLRCSVNRKVLYANAAARAESALFGDETREFLSPALAELVRQAFYEGKETTGQIRIKSDTIAFKAIPVLDSGYVNLYGGTKRPAQQ